jgi:hypothetical protein
MNPIIRQYAIVFVLLVICTSSGISQIRVGIRAGVYSTRIKADDFTFDGKFIRFDGKPRMGYHIGIVSQWESSRVFLQPELLFCSIRNDIYIDGSGIEELTELELNKIDLPVMLGYKWGTFKIQAGPVASVLINDKSELTDITGYNLLLRRATIGFQAGFGFDVSKLSLDFKYEGSLSSLDDGITIGNEEFEFDARARQLIFSIGLYF